MKDGITITTEAGRINVDAWDSYGEPIKVWLNIAVPMASASAVLTRDQAKELAAALTEFAEAS
jgi:hypothetical protein